jgi:hypothetical protein
VEIFPPTGRFLEQERFPAARPLHFTVGHFGDFQFTRYGDRNPLEFACPIQGRRKFPER